MVLALAFPTVTKIVVVTKQGHDVIVIVVVGLEMRFLVAWRTAVTVLKLAAGPPGTNVGYLRLLLHVVDQMKNRVGKWKVNRLALV